MVISGVVMVRWRRKKRRVRPICRKLGLDSFYREFGKTERWERWKNWFDNLKGIIDIT